MNATDFKKPSPIKWNEIEKVGTPPKDMCTYRIGECEVPRTFLCRGSYSIFTSMMYDDGSGFMDEGDDAVVAWAIVEGF